MPRLMCTLTLQHTKPPRTPITRELAVLYKRTFTEIIRNPTLLLMHCVMALIMGLLCGGIFWHISNDIAGAQNRLGEAAQPLRLLSCCNNRGFCAAEQPKQCLGMFPNASAANHGRFPCMRL